MAEQVFPTKGNLIKAKKTLALCNLGYELMDRKRNILIREMMTLMDKESLSGILLRIRIRRLMRLCREPI